MPVRFGKSIRLGKFVRLNISGSGVSMSAGAGGLRYSQQLVGGQKRKRSNSQPQQKKHTEAQPQQKVHIPKPPTPGLFAPGYEKAFYRGMQSHQEGKRDQALVAFREAAPKDAGAAVFAAILLLHAEQLDEAVSLLEQVLGADIEFPTPLLKKYAADVRIKIGITQEVSVDVPLDGLGTALLLAEVYQKQERVSEAIGILEELDELVDNPVLTLSLCDLYISASLWDGVIGAAERRIEVVDDITFETAILRARAMFEKGLHEAASAALTEALRKKKDRDPDLINEALYWRAHAYAGAGKKGQATKEFQKIYADDPLFRDIADLVA